jgi:hypothetical protein
VTPKVYGLPEEIDAEEVASILDVLHEPDFALMCAEAGIDLADPESIAAHVDKFNALFEQYMEKP